MLVYMMRFIFLFFSLFFSSVVLSLSLNQQREVYSDAKLLQTQNRWDEATDKLAVIPVYPLTYLLEYQFLKSNFSQQDGDLINDFISKNKQHKITNELQREYLYYLAENKHWAEFIAFYPKLPRSGKLKCFYFQAKMATGKEKAIWPDVKNAWLSGGSLPNACDSVFDYYLESEMINSDLIWQRFELAFERNKSSLMRYLIKMLEGEQKQLASELYALNKKPQNLIESNLFTNKDQTSYSFLKTMIKRLARVDIALAIQTYQLYEQKTHFTFKDEVEIKKYFVYQILINTEPELLAWSDETLVQLGDITLIEQRVRYAIKYNNWAEIDAWIMKLPQVKKQENIWVYWQARSLEEKKQFKEANDLYQTIAHQRKYYGFLAAQKLGLTYQLNANIVEPEVASLRYVQGQLDHIEELNFHQYESLVKTEWESLLQGRDVDVQRQLGLYAFDKGWAHLSVLASIRSKSWDAINIRFPEVNPELFTLYSLQYKVPSSYIYAITRQESSFDQFANSPVGATGYMQLMPATAKETARKIGLKNYKQKAQLTEGDINVQLGTAYFDSLLKRYKGNRILATAAYNAGPHRVDRWQKNKEGRDTEALRMDSWVESIPYKETRHYVKNVLAYNVIYQHILKEPMQFFNEMELDAYY